MTRRAMAILSTLLLAAALAPSLAGAEPLQGSYWYAVDHITSVKEDGRIVLWAVLPPERPEQHVQITAIVPEPVAILRDERNGNQVIEWTLRPEVGLESTAAFFHFDFVLDQVPVAYEFDLSEVRPYDETTHAFEQYVRSEYWIQTDGPILDQARLIVGTGTNPWKQALAIYDWVMENLTFVPGGFGDRDAVSTLQSERGDCGQFSVLFCALCRSIGIPARTVANVWTDGGAHISAEIYLEKLGWVPMDTSLGQMLMPGGGGMEPEEVRAYMESKGIPLGNPRWPAGHLYLNRLITSVGNNLRFESPTLGRHVEFQQMNPGGSAAHPAAIELEGLNRDVIHGGFFVFGREVADEKEAHELMHQELAHLFFREGLYDVAEGTCRKMTEQSAGGIQNWINEGKVYMHKGEYYRAEAAFKRAQTASATNRRDKLEAVVWTHNYLGNCYDLLGHREMAIAEYRQVVEAGNDYRGAVEYAKKYLKKPFDKKVVEDR